MKYILKRVIIGVAISLIVFNVKSCKVNALEIQQKIGGSNINGNSYFSVNTDGLTKNMNISYFYDLNNESDYDYAIKYNLISAPTGSGSNAHKKSYYFILSYCSNVGAAVTSIYNSNYNYIDANYNTTTICYANGNIGSLFNAYIRMAPTSVNIGNSSYQIIYFNNTLQLQSRFSYNGYVGFNALNILTPEEYQKALDDNSILNQQKLLNDNINAMKNQLHSDNQALNASIGAAASQAHSDSQTINSSIGAAASQAHSDSQNINSSIGAAASQAHTDSQTINQNIQNGNWQTHQDLNNINSTLTDETGPDSSKYSNLSQNNANNGVINSLVTLPINLARSYLNGFNSTCSPYNIGI